MVDEKVRIVSYNANSLTTLLKDGTTPGSAGKTMEEVVETCGRPDVLAVQETKVSAKTMAQKWRADARLDVKGYVSVWSYNETNNQKAMHGVATWVRKALVRDAWEWQPAFEAKSECEGRCVAVELAGGLVVFNVYCPNASNGLVRLGYKTRWLDAFGAEVARVARSGRRPMVVGDMNIVHHPAVDMVGGTDYETYQAAVDAKGDPVLGSFADVPDGARVAKMRPCLHPDERAWMTKFLGEGYRDAFRELHPVPEQDTPRDACTWFDQRKLASGGDVAAARLAAGGWRLDYALVPAAFVAPADGEAGAIRLISCERDTRALFGCDHIPLVTELRSAAFDEKAGKAPDSATYAACRLKPFKKRHADVSSFFVPMKKARA